MNKSRNYPDLENSHGSTSRVRLFGIVLAVLVAALIGAFCYFKFGDIAAAPIVQDEPARGIDHPAGETFECDLTFLDMDHVDLTMAKPQPSTPTPAPYNSHKLHADTEYIIQFDFPNMLLAEIENDDHDFEIDVKYDFKVERESKFHAEIKFYNKTSGNLYVASGSIEAADDLCVKHSFGAGTNYICDYPEFADDHFAFSFYTSALPDAGPKTTSESSFGRFNVSYTIAGRFTVPDPVKDCNPTRELTPPEN